MASTVTSHAPQVEQSSCTVDVRDRMDAVRPQKRQTAISESLTRLTRSPLLLLEGAGRFLKNPAIREIHPTRESYSREEALDVK